MIQIDIVITDEGYTHLPTNTLNVWKLIVRVINDKLSWRKRRLMKLELAPIVSKIEKQQFFNAFKIVSIISIRACIHNCCVGRNNMLIPAKIICGVDTIL